MERISKNFTYKFCIPKPVIIESVNRTRKPCFKNVFYKEDGKGYVMYHGYIYEHVGICERTNKMVFKKAPIQWVVSDEIKEKLA